MRAPGIAIVVVFGIAVLAAACGAAANVDNSQRDPTSGAITRRGNIGTQRLRVGDCFLDTGQDSTQVVQGVPCSLAHDSQVVALAELPDREGAEWPGEVELADQSRALCLGAASTAIGDNLNDPTIGLAAYVPDQRSWDANDRRVLCTLGRSDGSAITGSLLGTST